LPVIDLLKGYFKIQDRDDLREIREKVTAGGAVRVVWVRQQVRHQVLWWVWTLAGEGCPRRALAFAAGQP
jgi:hypothetical protein